MTTTNTLHHGGEPPQLQGEPSILRLSDVMSRTGLGRATIYRWMSRGSFPRHFKIGLSAVGWLKEEIDDWITAKSSARTLN